MAKPLSTQQIYKEIHKDPYARLTFLGVFAKNRLPQVKIYPCSLVVNTDPSDKPGEHWLAIYFNADKSCEFFDSYGNKPEYYGLDEYVKNNSVVYKNNNVRFQDLSSSSCGYYCIFFLLLKSRKFLFKEILDLFSKYDFRTNDFIVEHIVFD